MKSFVNAELLVHDPQFEQKGVIDSEYIESASFSERAGHRVDDGDITLLNDDGSININSGEIVELRVHFGGDRIEAWGDGEWGDSAWGGKRTLWTAKVRNVDNSYTGTGQELVNLDCEDYMFSLLTKRYVEAEYDDWNVGHILRHVIERNVPEARVYISRFFTEMAEKNFDGETVFDATEELLNRINAEMRSYRDQIIVRHYTEFEERFEDNNDFVINDKTVSDDGLINDVTVRGGIGHAEGPHTVEDPVYYRPTSNEKWRINTHKAELSALDIRLSVSRVPIEAAITIRVQKDDGGRPVDEDDTSMDISSSTLSGEEVIEQYRDREETDHMWIQFKFDEHTLPEPDPWVIMEVENDQLQRLVLDDDRTPLNIPRFPYHVITRRWDSQSIHQHGRREELINDSTLTTISSAGQLAEEILHANSDPVTVVDAQAISPRAYNLRAGDRIIFDKEEVSGEYRVTERNDTLTGINLETHYTFENVT